MLLNVAVGSLQPVVVSRLLDTPVLTHKRILSVNGSSIYLTLELQLSSPLTTHHMVSMEAQHALVTTLSSSMELVTMLTLSGSSVALHNFIVILIM